MTSKNIEHLREHGPTPKSELPNNKVSTSDRANGAWKFTISGTRQGTADPLGGNIDPVWYLEGEHDRAAVVRAFLDANPQLVEAKSRSGLRAMMRRNGSMWHDAIDAAYPTHPPTDDPLDRLKGAMERSVYEWFREHGPATSRDLADDIDAIDGTNNESSVRSTASRLKDDGYLEVVETNPMKGTNHDEHVLDAVEFEHEEPR